MIAITNRDGKSRASCAAVDVESRLSRATTRLADAIVKLKNDVEGCASMGQRARLMLDREFTREHALERWRSVIDTIH